MPRFRSGTPDTAEPLGTIRKEMKVLQIIILILIFTGCCKEPKFLKNGLTKNANKVTEISIKVEYDSLGNKRLDTISITKKFYDKNNQIVKRIQNTLFDNEIMGIEYIYDNSKKLQKEIVKMSFDTATVNYFYNDTLLFRTTSKTVNSEFEFEQITNHKYSQKNKISEVSTSQTFVDLESGDTTLNSLVVDKYNQKEQLIKSLTTNFKNPERNKIYSYKYKCGRLIESKGYNQKDSLISTTIFEYLFDEFDNWIEKKSFENSKLSYIKRRQIEYK